MAVFAGLPVEVGDTLLVASYYQACFQGQISCSRTIIDLWKGLSLIMGRLWCNGCAIANPDTEGE